MLYVQTLGITSPPKRLENRPLAARSIPALDIPSIRLL
uniref:Uncharacterized protein n=1 Tax=Rhizophora mucronata TaxID=61149 RepID=A0A2P2JG62_RHIMU